MGRTGLRQLHIDLSPNPTHEQRVSENLVPTSLETAELTQSEHGNHTKYPKSTEQLTRLENAENPNYYIAVWGRITLDKYLTPKTKNFQMDKQELQTETINSRGKYKNAFKAQLQERFSK